MLSQFQECERCNNIIEWGAAAGSGIFPVEMEQAIYNYDIFMATLSAKSVLELLSNLLEEIGAFGVEEIGVFGSSHAPPTDNIIAVCRFTSPS
jgi:predicted urease superfamily metal-dependent hydrolase